MVLAALSPVLVPETETAPEPMVSTEVLSTFPVRVVLPPLTIKFLVKVAPVTAVAVPPEARYWDDGVKAALPNVPPPVGIVRVAPAAGQDKVPTPPLLVKFVVKVSPVTEPALPVVLPEVPETFPVTFPVKAPANPVAVKIPVEGTKEREADVVFCGRLPVLAVTQVG